MKQSNYQGSALITALFIMTLVAIAATAMSSRLQLDIYRTQLTQTSDRLYLASEAVTFWAMDRLSNRSQMYTALDNEGKILNFPKKLSTIYPGVTIQGSLYDLQAKYNLNNLSNRLYLPVFYGILEQALPNSNAEERKEIMDATVNWITGRYLNNKTPDEWFDRYLKQRPVYFPGYQRMQHVSEFRAVYGITAKIYQQLKPYVTALPEITSININTASKAALQSLGNGLSPHAAGELITMRQKGAIKRMADIEPILHQFNVTNSEVSLDSQYFLSVATTHSDNQTLTMYTVIKRQEIAHHRVVLSVISRSFNAW